MNGDVKGEAAFAVSLGQDGSVSVAQYLSLKHPENPDNFDEPVNLGNLVNAVVTVTDGDGDVAVDTIAIGAQIGRASCRERVCQYVYISVVAVSLQKKTNTDKCEERVDI